MKLFFKLLFVFFIGVITFSACQNSDEKAVLTSTNGGAQKLSETPKDSTPKTMPTAIDTARLKKSTPAVQAAFYYREAKQLLSTQDTAQAILALEKAISLQKTQPTYLLHLAFLRAEQSSAQTLSLLSRARKYAKQESETAQAYFIEGVYYRNVHEGAKAIAAWNRAIRADWTFLDAYLEKGALLFRAHKTQEAFEVFKLAFRVNNRNAEVHYWLGRMYEIKNDTTRAVAFYRQALSFDKNFSLARLHLDKMTKQ